MCDNTETAQKIKNLKANYDSAIRHNLLERAGWFKERINQLNGDKNDGTKINT